MFHKTLLLMTVSLFSLGPTTAFAQSQQAKTIRSYGLGMPSNQVFLRSGVNGNVSNILFKEGEFVNQGDVIVELDNRSAKARKEIARLEAESTGLLQNAKAELDAARKNFQRYKSLKDQDAASEQEYSDSNLRFARAKAALKIEQERVAVNRVRFELAEADCDRYLLRAPFSGQVTQIQTTLGATVSDSMDLVQIVSMDSFRVELFLPVSEASKLKVDGVVTAKVGAPYQTLVDATVVFRSPMIEAATGTTRVVLNIDNRELNLPAGLVISLVDPTVKKSDVASRH